MTTNQTLRGKCCVCHHNLITHIDEGNGWRCHSIGADLYQCECFLRKGRLGKERSNLHYYDLGLRRREHLREFKEGRG